ALVVGEDGVARLLDLQREQPILLLAAAQRGHQRFDVLRHAVEGLDAQCGLGRPLERDSHAVLALPEALRAGGEGAKRPHAAAEHHQGHTERERGAQDENAELHPEAVPELVDGHRGVEPQGDRAVPFSADDDGLRILQDREAESRDEPPRRFDPDRRPEGRHRVAGVVGPRESGDRRLACARLHHLLDHRVVAHDGGAACLRTFALEASTFAPSGSSAILRNASRTALTASAGTDGRAERARLRYLSELHSVRYARFSRCAKARITSALTPAATTRPALSWPIAPSWLPAKWTLTWIPLRSSASIGR